MNYAQPQYISALIFSSIAMALFYIWAMKRRSSLMERFAERNMIEGIAPSFSAARKIWKMALCGMAFSLCILALARPEWGFEWQEVKRTGFDILIGMDVSKSMLAGDMRPTRLERAKYAVKDLIRKLAGDRIGLIAFAGTSFLQCPLTIDYNGFLLTLDDLNTETIPRPGTAISGAIREAIDILKGADKKFKIFVLITDGEELEGDAIKAAGEAAQSGVRIYCVGVGTQEGDIIPTIDERGEKGYLTDRAGQVIKTRLNEELLKRIAVATGGSYVRATSSDFGLILLYDKSISKLEKREIEAKMKKRYQERYQIFLGLAIAFLLLEPLISERKR